MVIDGQTVITGSFNFTKAAEENNAENLLVIRAKAGRQVHRQLEGPCRPFRALRGQERGDVPAEKKPRKRKAA